LDGRPIEPKWQLVNRVELSGRPSVWLADLDERARRGERLRRLVEHEFLGSVRSIRMTNWWPTQWPRFSRAAFVQGLEVLEIQDNAFGDKVLDELCATRWPKLERLVLGMHEGKESFGKIAESGAFPALRVFNGSGPYSQGGAHRQSFEQVGPQANAQLEVFAQAGRLPSIEVVYLNRLLRGVSPLTRGVLLDRLSELRLSSCAVSAGAFTHIIRRLLGMHTIDVPGIGEQIMYQVEMLADVDLSGVRCQHLDGSVCDPERAHPVSTSMSRRMAHGVRVWPRVHVRRFDHADVSEGGWLLCIIDGADQRFSMLCTRADSSRVPQDWVERLGDEDLDWVARMGKLGMSARVKHERRRRRGAVRGA